MSETAEPVSQAETLLIKFPQAWGLEDEEYNEKKAQLEEKLISAMGRANILFSTIPSSFEGSQSARAMLSGRMMIRT